MEAKIYPTFDPHSLYDLLSFFLLLEGGSLTVLVWLKPLNLRAVEDSSRVSQNPYLRFLLAVLTFALLGFQRATNLYQLAITTMGLDFNLDGFEDW